MEKNLVKYLTTVALVAITLDLTACGAMKPDHPQVRESFSDRRAPRDNMLAASGALGEKKEEKSSGFQAITPTSLAENKSGTEVNPSSLATSVQSNINSLPVINQFNQATPQSQTSSRTSGDSDFFTRLIDKVSSAFQTSSNNSAKRIPASNSYAMETHYSDVAQGSNAGYSFYDIADEVLPAQPVHQVSFQSISDIAPKKAMIKNAEFGYIATNDRINLAQATTTTPTPAVTTQEVVTPVVNPTAPVVAPIPAAPAAPVASIPSVAQPTTPNAATTQVETIVPKAPELPSTSAAKTTSESVPTTPSAPLATVPATPSMEELKDKIEKQPEPELKDTPKVPEEFKTEKKEETKVEEHQKETPLAVQAKPKKKKAVKKVSLPKEESRDPVAKNPESQNIYMMNGRKVATDFLDRSRTN